MCNNGVQQKRTQFTKNKINWSQSLAQVNCYYVTFSQITDTDCCNLETEKLCKKYGKLVDHKLKAQQKSEFNEAPAAYNRTLLCEGALKAGENDRFLSLIN